jgi:hypothetical protein
MKNKLKSERGFTIMEVLLSAFVLTFGIVAVLSLMSQSTVSSFDIRDSIIASELAQEGIELVRNERDNGMLADGASYNFSNLPDPLNASHSKCRIDYKNDMECDSGFSLDSYRLYRDNDGFFSKNVNGIATRFNRKMTIDDFSGGNGVRIRSIVSWDGVERTFANCDVSHHCVAIEDILTNWYNP